MRIQCIFHAILYAWTLELLKLSSVLWLKQVRYDIQTLRLENIAVQIFNTLVECLSVRMLLLTWLLKYQYDKFKFISFSFCIISKAWIRQ